MENITTELQELEKGELELYDEWKKVLSKRLKEDEEIKTSRAQEEEQWQQRLRHLNNQQDRLRRRRRELATDPLIPTPPAVTQCQPTPPAVTQFLPTPPVVTQCLPKGATPLPKRRSLRRRAKRGLPKVRLSQTTRTPRRSGATHWTPVSYDKNDQPLYERPSDRKLVYLECPIDGCDKTGFENVKQLMKHTGRAQTIAHNGQKHILINANNAVETCSRLAPEQEIVEDAGDNDRGEGIDAELQQSRVSAAEQMFQGFLSSGDETEDEVMQDDVSEEDIMQEDDLAIMSVRPSRPMVARFVSVDLGARFVDASHPVKIEQNP